MTEPSVAQDQTGALQLCLDPNPLDVALEADRITVQLMLDLEHLANLHEELVVGKSVPHLVGGRLMGI